MTISLPLSVTIPRKTKEDKVFALNLNTFRNAHHMTMNQAKVIWKDVVSGALQDWYTSDIDGSRYYADNAPYLFTYTVFPSSGRAFDLANVCAAIQKFTDDALQELNVIENDNYKHIRAVRYEFGKIDKENPRCELEITTWK
jgi:hypothetical protein